MFTGIVEELGKVDSVQRGAQSARIAVEAAGMAGGVAVGDSVAINGTCLTAVRVDGQRLEFEAVPETMRRTTLGRLSAGDAVNLERAIAAGARLGGHFVQGHVDGVGTLASVRVEDNAHVLRINAPPSLLRYMIPKGSVALDGISLTLVDVDAGSFTVWIIPHTYMHTTIQFRRPGDPLNIEVDLVARYVERLLQPQAAAGLSAARLAAAGFE